MYENGETIYQHSIPNYSTDVFIVGKKLYRLLVKRKLYTK